MTFRLTLAGANDIAAIMSVVDAAFDPGFGEAWSAAQILGSLATGTSWVRLAYDARYGPAAAGFSLCRRAGLEAELLLIGVRPSCRGRGSGAALLATAKSDAREYGTETLFLEVRDGNTAAMALYRSAGFGVIGRRRDYYRGINSMKFDAITLRCDLDI